MIEVTTFWVILGLLFFASIVLHEYGHYKAITQYGWHVKEFSLLGLPIIPIKFTLYTEKDKDLPTKFTIYPFAPIGAFVEPYFNEEFSEALKKESLEKRIWIYASGPMYNFLFGFALIAVSFACVAIYELDWRSAIIASIFTGLIFIFLRYKNQIITYVFPVLGMLVFASLVYDFIQSSLQIGTVDTLKNISVSHGIMTLHNTVQDVPRIHFLIPVILSGMLSVLIGVVNLMPLFILDGGYIYEAILDKYDMYKTKLLLYATTPVTFIFLILPILAEFI